MFTASTMETVMALESTKFWSSTSLPNTRKRTHRRGSRSQREPMLCPKTFRRFNRQAVPASSPSPPRAEQKSGNKRCRSIGPQILQMLFAIRTLDPLTQSQEVGPSLCQIRTSDIDWLTAHKIWHPNWGNLPLLPLPSISGHLVVRLQWDERAEPISMRLHVESTLV